MPHLVVIQLMRVIKWPRSHSHGSCVNKKGRGYKGFYSITPIFKMLLQNIQRRVVGSFLIDVSFSNIFLTMVSPEEERFRRPGNYIHWLAHSKIFRKG